MAPAKQTQTNSPASDKQTTGQTEQQGAQEAEQQPSAGALATQAQRAPRTLGARDLLSLQRTIGNREVGRMLAPAHRRPQDSSADQQDSDAQVQRHAEPVAAASPSIQRLAGLPQNTHVEVNDGGPLWYGEIVEVLNGSYRVRVGGMDKVVNVPEAQVTWHPSVLAVRASSLADQIIAAGAGAPGAGEIDGLVGEWRTRTGPAHNPLLTLSAMKTGHAISVNPQLQILLQTPAGVEIVKEVFKELQTKTGRQFIQFWEEAPATVIEVRGQAWAMFREGVATLQGQQAKLDLYFYKTLAHDKGYAQIFEAAQQYLEISFDTGQVQEESFDQIVTRAFNEPKNMNMWSGGQAGSGKVSAQLARGFEPVSELLPLYKQEDLMWGQLITAIIQAYNPVKMDWSYAPTILANKEALLARVNELLPGQQEVHMENLVKALALFGVEEDDEDV
ncbi:MAG TPA: hypothetical protein VFS21_09010 [Roseiflexaceae bacterium]|nr:hypothetical protein [Roseiflexaceae bacterium]